MTAKFGPFSSETRNKMRRVLCCTAVVIGVPLAVGVVSGALADPLPEGQTMQAPSSVVQYEAQRTSISDQVSQMMQQKLATPATTAASSSTLPSVAIPPINDTPRSVVQAEDEATIKSNVFKLYNEGRTVPATPAVAGTPVSLPAPTPVAVIPPPAPVQALDTTPTVATSSPPSTSIAPAAPVPVGLPVTQKVDSSAPPKAVSAQKATSPAPIVAAAVVPPVPTPDPVAAGPAPPNPALNADKLAVVKQAADAPPATPAVEKPSLQPLSEKKAVEKSIEKTDAKPISQSFADDPNAGAADAAYLKNLAGADQILALNTANGGNDPRLDEPIAISESVAFALRNNFEIQAGEEKLHSAYWDKIGAYSQFAPTVNFDYSQGSEQSDPASYNDALGNRVLESTHFRRDRSLTVRQPIIDLGVVSDILSAGDKENIAKADQRDAREGIASDTVNAFLKLLQARISVRLAEQYKEYLDNLSKRMTARVEGGGATGADLDRVKSRASAAENARIEAMGQYETDLAEYRRLTRVSPSQFKIPDVLSPPIPETAQVALEAAFRQNPAYRSSLDKIDAAADDRNKSYSGLLPKLSVQYGKDFTYDAGGAAKGNPVDGVYPDQTTETVMLVAQWSLNGGTAIAGGVSGMAKEREMDLHAQDVRARMEQGIRSGYTAINSARERRRVLQKSVEENERVVKGFEDQYKDGNRSLFDLLDAYEQLYSSRLNLMRIVVANAEAAYAIRRQMGELIPSIISEGDKE